MNNDPTNTMPTYIIVARPKPSPNRSKNLNDGNTMTCLVKAVRANLLIRDSNDTKRVLSVATVRKFFT